MVNPFCTLGYAGPEYFCDRVSETGKLMEALVNGRNVTLISPRRLGKTGLILHTFNALQAEDSSRRCFYIDIYNTQNQAALVQALSQEILGKMDSYSEKLFAKMSGFFKSCRPVLSMDPTTGSPSLSLDLQPQNSTQSMKEIIGYMKESGHECFVAIDEFQQILEYPEEGTEALLRSLTQFAPNVHFIFAGSKQHLMSAIFSSPRRPFYQCTQHIGLQPLDEGVYYEFCARMMEKGGRRLPQDVFMEVYAFAHGFTYYVQDIMNRLYSRYEGEITMVHLAAIYREIRDEGETIYKDYCDLLARGQLKLLRALAAEDCVVRPFESSFMRRHNLSAPSSLRLSMNVLVKNGIVAKDPDGYYIYDRYLSLWLSPRHTH